MLRTGHHGAAEFARNQSATRRSESVQVTAPAATLEVPFGRIGPVLIRPLSLEQDIAVLHDWLNRDYARFWGLQGQSLPQIRANLAATLAQPGSEVLIGELAATGERKFMFESYDIRFDRMNPYLGARPGDRGFHVFLGPPEPPVPAAAYYTLQGLAAWIFRDPEVQRLVGEPDVRNHKVLVRLAQGGFSFGRVIHMPNHWPREDFSGFIWLPIDNHGTQEPDQRAVQQSPL